MSKNTVARAIAKGKLPATKGENGFYRIDPEDLAKVYGVRPETERMVRSGTAREVDLLRDLVEELRTSRDEARQARDEWKATAEEWKAEAERLAAAKPK